MTDEECQRRINRDFDYRTLLAEGALMMIFVAGVLILMAYLATT